MARTINLDAVAAMSARDIAGQYMVELGSKIPEMVMVNADLATSGRMVTFAKQFPDKSYNVGIAEQNMASFAAGLAHEGFVPIFSTMAPFLSMRAAEQIRTDICYGQLHVIMLGTGAGYSGGHQGATHCAMEDVAILGSFAGMTVLEPGDPWMIIKMLDAAFAANGPVYIRIGREALEPIYKEDYEYEIGKALTTVEGDDGAFIVSGPCVNFAIAASQAILEKTGKKIRVVDMHTIKPVDKDAVLSAAKTGRIVVAQDHNIIGGLGYFVGVVLAEAGVGVKFMILGIPDKFVPLATPDFLYAENEIDAAGLEKNMLAFF